MSDENKISDADLEGVAGGAKGMSKEEMLKAKKTATSDSSDHKPMPGAGDAFDPKPDPAGKLDSKGK